MAREWPDYESEMQKKAKARKRGDAFIVSDDDDNMKDNQYRTKKRKQNGMETYDWFVFGCSFVPFSWIIIPN